MSERRFVLIDLNSRPGNNWLIEYNRNDIITESELKKRFIEATQTIVIDQVTGDIANWGEVLKELLHGEKEQPWPGPEDILEMRGKEQPDEWEEWLSRCPTMYLREWFTDMVQILRRKP